MFKIPEKRTPTAWTEFLNRTEEPVTLDEYIAGCLSRILAYTVESAQAARHFEGMLGAFDEYNAILAQMQGLPYAGSKTVREALDEKRRQENVPSLNGASPIGEE